MMRFLPFVVVFLALRSDLLSADTFDCVINPSSNIELGSHQDGVLEEMLVRRGDKVKQGQPLASLDREMQEIDTELSRIRAESDTAVRSNRIQAEFRAREQKRLASLRDNNSVSESVFEQADNDYNLSLLATESAELERKIARASYRRAQAQLERRIIKSPVEGIVVDVVMSPGEYVHEQSTLMTLAAVDPLYVEVYIPVVSYGQVQEGMSAMIRPEQPVGGEHHATVSAVDQVFDAASRTFGVRLELPNPNYDLPAGMRCTVTFTE